MQFGDITPNDAFYLYLIVASQVPVYGSHAFILHSR